MAATSTSGYPERGSRKPEGLPTWTLAKTKREKKGKERDSRRKNLGKEVKEGGKILLGSVVVAGLIRAEQRKTEISRSSGGGKKKKSQRRPPANRTTHLPACRGPSKQPDRGRSDPIRWVKNGRGPEEAGSARSSSMLLESLPSSKERHARALAVREKGFVW